MAARVSLRVGEPVHGVVNAPEVLMHAYDRPARETLLDEAEIIRIMKHSAMRGKLPPRRRASNHGCYVQQRCVLKL